MYSYRGQRYMFFVVIKSIMVDHKEDAARSACPYYAL
jgi:hypothetical protein